MATTVPLQGKEPRNKIRRVCVFCGARTGSRAEFVEQAEAFGRELARKGWGLVYGGMRTVQRSCSCSCALSP